MLSLQWEPEIIAVAVMYLAGRLCKFDIQEWTSKQSSRRWWEQFVQDVPVELLEGNQINIWQCAFNTFSMPLLQYIYLDVEKITLVV